VLNLRELCKVDIPEGRSGVWYVEKFEVKDDVKRSIFNLHARGRDVPVGTYTRLMRDKSFDNPMMSDTPAEIYDHAEAVYKIQELGGRILLNGLGLGCILKAALSFSNVERVDVVELEQDIINLVAPAYKDPRVHIYCADAHAIKWDKSDRWTVAWHDIWANICTDNLEDMAHLHRKYGHKVMWQGSWSKEECVAQKRRGGFW
jgi:hypothetical protein